MDEYKDLIQTLLSRGIATSNSVDLSKLNRIFMKIGYEAIEFPHRKVIVLKDRFTDRTPDSMWTDERVKEVQLILERVCKNTYTENTGVGMKDTVEMMINCSYLRMEDGKLCLTERSLVQFSDFIQKYLSRCELCGFITEEGTYHKKCKSILKR